MGLWAARKARDILRNARRVLAIEYLTAAQALDFTDLEPGGGVAAVRDRLRENVAHLEKDRYLARDILEAEGLLADGELLSAAEGAAGELASF